MCYDNDNERPPQFDHQDGLYFTSIRIFDLGRKRANVDEFPFWCHIVSDEYKVSGIVIDILRWGINGQLRVLILGRLSYPEVFRHARYKFPGRQKIIVWKKGRFTNVGKDEYLELKDEKLQCVHILKV